jgi:hypothetical protein
MTNLGRFISLPNPVEPVSVCLVRTKCEFADELICAVLFIDRNELVRFRLYSVSYLSNSLPLCHF